MRLLQHNYRGDIHLTKDYLGDDIPPYAILSHTWGSDEVTLKDLMDGSGKGKLGYEKIQFCGRQALRDGLQYFWVDTCCIDKSSSAELQEAINSMYRWYKDAVKCYVYLADVSKTEAIPDNELARLKWKAAFSYSRWFTRGWTLQELIAPRSVEFFSKEGTKLGNKKSLEDEICEITELPFHALRGRPLSNFSVSQRLSWAKKRNTTRAEDKAYSLLGIFDIHMPLLYGEGTEKAFRRLKEEIGKASKSEFLEPATYQPRCFTCPSPFSIEKKKPHQLTVTRKATSLGTIPLMITATNVSHLSHFYYDDC
ncbi:HET-domain-containing protein [Fusarium austroafricanum]|uniref:HET-domain-containing protein n=1 Tax=Fusarium austroafricanum TaxID=2364996 RepID=A0A8H4NDV1_9HYPO|nr:HET-domain-containing protein [Fusarium austroafricanum]